MTDESIIKILEGLNTGKGDGGKITIGQIAENVFFGYYYEPVSSGKHIRCRGDKMYFIKAEDGFFAAAVHWLGDHDLHWLVLPVYRRKSLLPLHLISTIFPHIFYSNPDLEEQRATLALQREWASFSRRIAEKVGFQILEDNEDKVVFVLPRRLVRKYSRYKVDSTNKPSIEESVRQAELLFRHLNFITDNFETHYACNGNREYLDRVRAELRHLRIDLIDLLQWTSF